MTALPRKSFTIRPHDVQGWWLSDDRRFAENTRILLLELEDAVRLVNAAWPKPLNETLRDEEHTPELMALIRKRDLLSDSVGAFSAIAIESFLNFYGVVRLGESEYSAHFERLSLVPKLRQLLLICDNLSITESDPLVTILRRIANKRNTLVHPKAKELTGYVPAENREGRKIPECARESVQDMDLFFVQFVDAVPRARHLVPSQAST